ncbi:MAG: hypothetical protein GY863_21985, partial [bacterium]|nr:hypothetical protein [bacterium]
GGRTWSSINNQLTAELYQVAVDDQFPYWVYAGQQDNSTIMVPSLPPYSPSIGPTGYWQAIGGCETGPAVPKPGNHNIVYANCKGRFGRYNKETGQEKQYYVGASNMYGHNPKDLKYRFQRVSPIHVSPHDPNIVYHASQYLHKTTDEGVTWETISPDLTAFEPDKQVISGSPITRDITGEECYSTIYAIQESPLQKGVIWVGANDGPVHVTKDGGETWTNVTPPSLPPGGRVQTIEPSPHRPGKAFFATYRYLMGDWKPYIYKTMDYGETWSLLTNGENGIPADFPTRVIREDTDREGLLYAGTEFGMFISFDDGFSWQKFQLNLPITPITDIKVYRKDLVLSTMGRSFWILDDITPLHQLSDEVASSNSHLYTPRKAYRMRYRGFRGGSANPEYIQPGVIIDYYLSEQPSELKLEILDAYGNLVRSFSSRPSSEQYADIESMVIDREALKSAGTPRIDKSAGMHRFIWDMTHAGSWHPNERMAGRRGPTVVPGIYQVRVSAGNWSQTERFELLADPRIVKDGVTQYDMIAQQNISLKVRDLISRTNLTIERINGAKEGANRRDAEKLDELYNRIVTAGGRYPQPMLANQVSYLYSMLDRADQKPGKDAYIRYDELKTQLEEIITELGQINN